MLVFHEKNEYLGFDISEKEIVRGKWKTESVTNCPQTNDVKAVSSFIELASFF